MAIGRYPQPTPISRDEFEALQGVTDNLIIDQLETTMALDAIIETLLEV